VLIGKNLVAHRRRNSTTSIVYALSLSFVILCVVAYNLQFQNAKLVVNKFVASVELKNDVGLSFSGLERYLFSQRKHIESFAWSSMPLEVSEHGDTYVSSYSRYKTIPVEIIGVTPNVYDILNKDYLDIAYSPSSLNLGEQLYTVRGTYGGGIGEFLASNIDAMYGEKTKSPSFLINLENDDGTVKFFKLKSSFVLNNSPTYEMNSRRGLLKETVLVSLPSYLAYSGKMDRGGLDNIKFRSLYLKFK
jgi:hypothetical protein